MAHGAPRGFVCSLLLLVVASAAGAKVVDRVVAAVDGEPITSYQLGIWASARGIKDPSEPGVLQDMITSRIIEKEAAAQGLAATDQEVKSYLEEVRRRAGMTAEEFARALVEQGTTMEAYRARVKVDIERSHLIQREIASKVNVTPEEVRRYYRAHLADYSLPARVEVSHILIPVAPDAPPAEVATARAKAEELRRKLLDGADFAALARKYSRGPGAREGGRLGEFARGEMLPALEKAAFSLKPGEVSEPVRSPLGFHLLRVDKRTEAAPRALAEVEDAIRDKLYRQALEQRFERWLREDLRRRHDVEVKR